MSECLKCKRVVTRKKHTCFGCGREIPAGQSVLCETWVDDILTTSYTCLVCERFANENLKFGDEYNEHRLPEYDPDEWERLRCEMEGSKNV